MLDKYRKKYLPYLQIQCDEHGVETRFVDTIISIESAWNPWAVRYEKNWVYFQAASEYARALRITLDTEMNCQKQSYGLGQIMGGTARSTGYVNELTTLFVPENNIPLMCKIVAKNKDKYPDMLDQASAYNAGFANKISPGYYANQDYVDRFKARYAQLAAEYK